MENSYADRLIASRPFAMNRSLRDLLALYDDVPLCIVLRQKAYLNRHFLQSVSDGGRSLPTK
jgi:hypothetical protein